MCQWFECSNETDVRHHTELKVVCKIHRKNVCYHYSLTILIALGLACYFYSVVIGFPQDSRVRLSGTRYAHNRSYIHLYTRTQAILYRGANFLGRLLFHIVVFFQTDL